MIIYEIYLYIIIGYMKKILMCYISTIEEGSKERVISYEIEI
jgi:hypothetical protein